ncbi:MAG: radical SAM family heme chaperone HemW [Bacteroidales bacterium]
MSGVYIHIPFCKKKCPYCDFYSSTKDYSHLFYVEALKREIVLRSRSAGSYIGSVYFGGGTPSLLGPELISQIIEKIREAFKVDNEAEITIECNPDDLSLNYLQNLKAVGINRISLGTQSFNDNELKLLGRRHSVSANHNALGMVFSCGFENVSIDLIYGLPGSSVDTIKKSISEALKYPVKHISAYHLTFEQNTRFYSLLKQGVLKELSEDESKEQYDMLVETLSNKGFEQYEISNFAKEKMYSRHNSIYWKGMPYIGVGASAHSFDGNTREWNVADVKEYIASLNNRIIPSEKEILTEDNKYNEYILTGLRTKWGINKKEILEKFGKQTLENIQTTAQKYIESGDMAENRGNYILTRKGFFIADYITSDLM